MEIFRLRLPRPFLLSYLTVALLFLAISLIDSPKLHLWGIFLISSVYNCSFHFSFVLHTVRTFSLSPFRNSAMFCLFRLSNTLSELWVKKVVKLIPVRSKV